MRPVLILALALLAGNASPLTAQGGTAGTSSSAGAPGAVATPVPRRLTPSDSARVDSIVWLGRRVAYLGLFPEAVAVYTKGLELFPDEPHLLRHRGHRYITLRDYPRAIADLERAAAVTRGQPDEVEPDGQPNAQNIPRSSLQRNIWYHLGLARWLAGDATGTAAAYETCIAMGGNGDSKVSCASWLWQAYRRLGRDADAQRVALAGARDDDVIENMNYRALLRLYAGLATEREVLGDGVAATGSGNASLAYGVGAWHLANGRRADAERLWRQLLAMPGQRYAFGYLAAEAELARLSTPR